MSIDKRRTDMPTPRNQESATRKAVKVPRGRIFTREAGIFKLLGIGDSGVPGGYSTRKHELTDCRQKHRLREE